MAVMDPSLDPLARYCSKRNFSITSEPRGENGRPGSARSFVIQKHAASRLHYDFRLELDGAAAFSARARPGLGVPVSWDALPKLKSGAQWTIATAREYLSFQAADPWSAYWTTRQSLAGAMKTLGFVASRRKPKA